MACCPFSFPGIVGWQHLHVEVEVEAGFKPWSSLERHSLKEGAACNLQPCVFGMYGGVALPVLPSLAGLVPAASRRRVPSQPWPCAAICCRIPLLRAFPQSLGSVSRGWLGAQQSRGWQMGCKQISPETWLALVGCSLKRNRSW